MFPRKSGLFYFKKMFSFTFTLQIQPQVQKYHIVLNWIYNKTIKKKYCQKK